MWPTLECSLRTLTSFIASDDHRPGEELPGKSFTVTPGFEKFQTGSGALTHDFELGSVAGERMVIPYQSWMLQRLLPVLEACVATPAGRISVETMLQDFPGHRNFLELERALRGCRIRKKGGLLFSEEIA